MVGARRQFIGLRLDEFPSAEIDFLGVAQEVLGAGLGFFFGQIRTGSGFGDGVMDGVQGSIGQEHDEIFLFLRIPEIARGPEGRGYFVAVDSIDGSDADGSTKVFVDQRVECVLDGDGAMVGGGILAQLPKHFIRPQSRFAAVQRESNEIADSLRLDDPEREKSEHARGSQYDQGTPIQGLVRRDAAAASQWVLLR